MDIFSTIFLFKHQRNQFLLAAYCYSWAGTVGQCFY